MNNPSCSLLLVLAKHRKDHSRWIWLNFKNHQNHWSTNQHTKHLLHNGEMVLRRCRGTPVRHWLRKGYKNAQWFGVYIAWSLFALTEYQCWYKQEYGIRENTVVADPVITTHHSRFTVPVDKQLELTTDEKSHFSTRIPFEVHWRVVCMLPNLSIEILGNVEPPLNNRPTTLLDVWYIAGTKARAWSWYPFYEIRIANKIIYFSYKRIN